MSGKALTTLGSKGEGPGEFNWPEHIVYDAPHLYVFDGAREKLYRMNPDTGIITKTWSVSNMCVFDVKGDDLAAAFMLPRESNIYGTLSLQNKNPHFDKTFGSPPCCLQVNGSKRAAVHIDEQGHFWMAYSGQFKIEHYSKSGRLIRRITDELPDYKVPSQAKKVSRFDRRGISANVISFDKITGLFEVNDTMVLYRFKRLADAYYDVFSKDGKRQGSFRSENLKPVGVHKQSLYAFKRGSASDPWDIQLVRLDF